MFENLRRQILGDPRDRNALAEHLVFHEMYKKGGILDHLDDEASLDTRDSYIREGLRSFANESNTEKLGESLTEVITEESFYSSVEDVRSYGKSADQKIKSLIREVSRKTREALGDAEESSIDDFLGKSLYKTFFESPTPSLLSYHYKGLIDKRDSLASKLYTDLVPTDGLDDVSYYMSSGRFDSGMSPSERRVGSASFGYSFNEDQESIRDKKAQAYDITSSLDRRIFRTRYEIARSLGKTYKQSSIADAMDFLDPFLQRSNGFINKPGIAPFVSLIETSENFLDLDMFQFQNEYLADLYFNKILENSAKIASDGFRVRVRIAGNDEGSRGETGFSILGPNKIQLERFALLREEIVKKLAEKKRDDENIDIEEALFQAREIVYKNFQLVETDRKNHRKLFINEKLAVLGSANLTQPVGSSIYQEGSTYEGIRFFKRHKWYEEAINTSSWNGNLYPEIKRRMRSEGKTYEQVNRDIRDTKLYKQVQELNERVQSDPSARLMVSEQSNIALSYDIGKHLRRTLEYAETYKSTSMHLMLDQPYLLQFGGDPWKGEMGADESLSRSKKRKQVYERNIQDRLYRLIGEGRAQIVVDVRNYREKVIDPLYREVSEALGDEFRDRYGSNLEKLVDISKSFEQRQEHLRNIFGAHSFDPKKNGFSNSEQLVRQLIVATSGQVILSTQSKQHLKSYGLFDSIGNLISYYMGSSNLGPGSIALNKMDAAANEELGLILDSLNVTNEDYKRGNKWTLDAKETTEELISSASNFRNQWNVLTGADPRLSLSSRRASWEKDVDTDGLERLASNFRQVNEELGFEAIKLNYLMGGSTGSKRVGLNVEINTSAITGLQNVPRINYKFATLEYAPGEKDKSGYVLAIDQSKAIGRSLFVNDRNKESIPMPFGIGEKGSIAAGSSAILDPIQNTSVRIATMVGELAYKSMALGPTQYLQSIYGDDAIFSTFIGYMEYLGTGRNEDGNWLVNKADRYDIERLAHSLKTRFDSADRNRAREITGTDSSSIDRERKQHLDLIYAYLEELKDTYIDPSTAINEDLKLALVESKDKRRTVLAKMAAAWKQQDISMWQDLVLDTVTSFNDFGYESFINSQIRDTSKYILEDAVTQGKQSSYGGPQGYMKMGLLGVNDSQQYKFLTERSRAKFKGIGKIMNLARFIPLTYGPTDEIYLPGAFRSVAEGGGSRPSTNYWSGITMFGIARQEIGTVADVEVVNHIGAGYTSTIRQLMDYLLSSNLASTEAEAEKLVRDSIGNQVGSLDTNIVTYMLSPGKVSQIAQRMKNFMGSQPLHVINEEVSRIMEQERSLDGKPAYEGLSNYLSQRMGALKADVARVLQINDATINAEGAKRKAEALIDDSYVYSFLMGGGLRKVLGKESSRVVALEKAAVLEELGIDESQVQHNKALVDQLLRARLVRRDVISPGIKGFIGPVEGKPQITFIQLGGAYSDYFQANPLYGGQYGQREGFIDRQEKRLKASMLSNNWTDDRSNKVIAHEGDYVSYDREKQRIVVVGGIKSGANGAVRSFPLDSLSSDNIRQLKGMVDSMGMRNVFADVADNQRLVSGESSFATYKASTWDSAGEDSIEYTLSSKWLVADPETNQSIFEMMLLRTKKPGGGSRFDAAGSLFKAVSHFLSDDTMKLILSNIRDSYNTDEIKHAHDWKSIGSRVDIHNVLGLGGPSHMKSYSFEHGASLLSEKDLISRTLDNSDKHLAMSMLLGFGTGFIDLSNSNVEGIKRIKRLMYQQAIEGTMGSYYKELAVRSSLKADFTKRINKAADEYIKVNFLTTSKEGLLSDVSLKRQIVAEVIAEDILKGSAFSLESTPDLIGFKAADIEAALSGSGGSVIKDRLEALFLDANNVLNKQGHLDFTNEKQRSAINMIAAIDLNLQLASQSLSKNMPNDINLKDRRILKQIAAEIGSYDLYRIDYDDAYAQEVENNIDPFLTSYKVLALRTSNTFSQSKVAMGKKYEANLELQYMMKNFTGAFKALKSGGSLSQIKKAVATIYKATSTVEDLMVSDIEDVLSVENIRGFHDMEFASYGSKKSLGKNRFLGVYGGASNLSNIKKIRQDMIGIAESNREAAKEVIREIKDKAALRQNAINSNNEVLIRSLNDDLRDLFSKLVALQTDSNRAMRGSTIEAQLRDMGRELESNSEKGFGVGQAKDFLDAMETSGQKSFMFALPSITSTDRLPGKKGQLRISFDYTNPTYVFMPDAQMLKNLGVEFGSYIADELKYTMILSTGFSPGTTMSLIRDQLAVNMTRGRNEVVINEDDYSKVQQYWQVASQMTHLLTMSASGTISKRAFANENRLPGVVSTAVGSFLVPENMAVIARAGLERHGIEMNPKRKEALRGLKALVRGELSDAEREHNENRKERLRQRSRTGTLTPQQERNVLSSDKRNVRTQIKGIASGASPEAVNLLKKIRSFTQEFESKIKSIESNSISSRDNQLQLLSLLKEKVTSLRKEIEGHSSLDGAGDNYMIEVARAERRYWSATIDKLILIKNKELETDPSRIKRYDSQIRTKSENIKNLLTAPWVLKGFSVGREFKFKDKGHYITKLEIEEMENSVRGRTGVKQWDEEHWKSLTNGDLRMNDDMQRELFIRMLENKLSAYQQMRENFAQNRGTSSYISLPTDKIERKSIYNTSAQQDLQLLEKGILRIINDLRDPNFNLVDAQARFSNLLTNLDTTELSEAFVTRSSPTGGLEHQRQIFGILRNLTEINSDRESSGNLFKSDISRNQTLTLINPLSQITMALGDFDGDPYTAIFTGMADMSNAAQKIQDKITAIDIKLTSLRNRLSNLEADRRLHQQIADVSLFSTTNRHSLYYMGGTRGPFLTGKTESDVLEEIAKLRPQEARLEQAKTDASRKAHQMNLKISAAREMLDPTIYNKALRKDAANYMGLNLSMFEANTTVGSESSALVSIDNSIIPVLIEQGSGLFSGLENKGKDLQRIHSMLDEIVRKKDDSLTLFVRVRKDKDEIRQYINTLSTQEGPNKNYYQILRDLGEQREALIDEIATQMNALNNRSEYQSREDYSKTLSELGNKVYQSFSGLKETQGKIAQAAGITVDYSTYDFITKVLGKAGGDLLGKTYNTLIGTLYSDAPLIAMASAMGLDMADGEAGATKALIQSSIRNAVGDETADTLFDHVRSSYDQAAATQGFMKNIHQLLRDSIKFKSDKGNLVEQLRTKAATYDKASPEDRDKIITEMTAALGPGPGLSAIMNLNTLILQRDKIDSGLKVMNNGEVNQYLSTTFGMSTFGTVDDQGNLMRDNGLGFNLYRDEYARLSNKDLKDVSLLDVVNYKVSEDLKTLVAAYRYEKYVSDHKAGIITSYGYLEKEAVNILYRSGDSRYEELRRKGAVYTGDGGVDHINYNALKSNLGGTFENGEVIGTVFDSLVDGSLRSWYSSLPANKKKRVAEIAGVSFYDESLSISQRAVIKSFIEEEDRQSSKFLGMHGEGLNRFVTLSQVRMGLSGVMEGTTSLSSQFAEADVALTMLNLATQDKLSASAQATFFQEMVKTAGLVGSAPIKEDYDGDDEAYSAARKQYENDIKQSIIKRMMGVEGDGGSSLFLDTSNEEVDKRTAFKVALDSFFSSNITIDNIEYGKGIEFLSTQIEDTAAGQRQSMLEAIIKADDRNFGKADISGKGIYEIAESLLKDDADSSEVYDLMYKLTELNLDASNPIEALRRQSQARTAKYKEIYEKDYRIVERETAKAQRSSNVIDYIAPIALTLLGGAVMAGGITEDHIGQMIGASVTTLAYSKQSLASKSALAVSGSAFRIKASIEQAGSEEEGFVKYLGQEIAFNFGALAVAPVVENLVNRSVARGIDPNLKFKDAIRSDINPIAYKLKSGAVLDVDRFASTKAISGSISSAVFSALIGLTMGAAVGEMIAAPKKIRTDSAIDLAIEGLGNSVREAMKWRAASEIGEDDMVIVEDENGAEYVDSESNIESMESIYNSAIDPIEDFSYIHFDAPPFVMVGVSITSEEYS